MGCRIRADWKITVNLGPEAGRRERGLEPDGAKCETLPVMNPLRPRCRPSAAAAGRRLDGRLLLPVVLALATVLGAREDTPVLMDPLLVPVGREDARYDGTGLGSLEAERTDPPFSNDLVSGAETEEEDLGAELNTELQAIATVNPVDLAAGVSRVDLRGFPTPRLRNGFTQLGVPEVLNPERTELIQGPLTPVTGQAAPGGIQNFMTARPRSQPSRRLSVSATTSESRQARFETTSPLVPRKAWYRLAGAWSRKDGPQAFAYRETRGIEGALTVRHHPKASTLLQFDYQEMRGNIAPGLPEYRENRTGKVIGPYLPLADFNAAGPGTGLRKRVWNVSLLVEAQPWRPLALRAGVQAYGRVLDEDRWTTGQFVLDSGKFGGTREPQHYEQPLRAVVGQVDATLRFARSGVDHKVLASLAHSRVTYDRLQRGLDAAERAQLPLSVRSFDPYEPDYFQPAYSPDYFRRVITDRSERTGYTTLVVSERAAFAHGKVVATAGLRADRVEFLLEDRKPGADRPLVRDRTSEVTWHAGANYLVKPSRLLLFGNASTAFQPSTRVDARTGQLQGNDTTRGLELGAKGLFFDRRLHLTALVYAFANQNISRRNPLYNDPILDAQLTQPELVASGEEEFTGASVDVRGQITPHWSVSGRAGYTRAVTVRSPDLPQEEGRSLTRIPRYTFALQQRYGFSAGRWNGLSLGMGLTYIGEFVQNYEGSSRAYLAYPSYVLTSVNAGYRWREGKRQHTVGLSCSNLLDRDLLASHARVGAERDVGVSYSLTY